MATVKVQRVKSKNPQTQEEMYYLQVKSAGTMSTDDLVENIVREGQIPKIYAQGVLDYLNTALFDYLKAGLSVQIPGLGTMTMMVKSKAQKLAKDATISSITGTRLRLIPFAKVKREMDACKFRMADGIADDDAGKAAAQPTLVTES